MFGSVYFGQMYFAGAILVPVIPPVPPTPPSGEGSAGGGGREGQKARAIRSHTYRVDLLAPDSDVRRLIQDARVQYAKDHPINRPPSKISIPSRKKTDQEIAEEQNKQKVYCSLSATFLINKSNVVASLNQLINSRATFSSNKIIVHAYIETDASYSNGLNDEETISLLQLV